MSFKFKNIIPVVCLLISCGGNISFGITNTNIVVSAKTRNIKSFVYKQSRNFDNWLAVDNDVDGFVKDWSDRIQKQVLDNINKAKREQNASDLYYELKPVLLANMNKLSDTLQHPKEIPEEDIPAVQHCFKNVLALYRMRIILLHEMPATLYLRETGTGIDGVRELRTELNALGLQYRYRQFTIPYEFKMQIESIKLAPLPFVRRYIIFLFVLFAFFVWRRWAKAFIPQLRLMVLDIKPRTKVNVRIARFLWYLERVRGPVEFLIFWWIIFNLIDAYWLISIINRLWIAIFWVLIAQFFIKFINAVIERGSSSVLSDDTGLRLKTLRLFAVWLLFLGLGADFTAVYIGHGTLYEWIWRLFQWLLVPVVIILVVWWRSEIIKSLKNEPKQTAFIKKLTSREKGLKSYFYAFAGGVFLLWQGLIRYLYNIISRMEWGRQLLAGYYRYEVNRENEKNKTTESYKDIPNDLCKRIIEHDNKIINKVVAKEVKALRSLFAVEGSGRTIVVGDRGSGKSTLLRRLQKDIGDKMLIISCDRGGAQNLLTAFGKLMPNVRGVPTVENVKMFLAESNISVIAIDNVHNLSRPVIDGQKSFNVVNSLSEDSRQRIKWIFTCNYSAWGYISRVLEHKLVKNETIFLREWNENSIEELVNNNCEDVGIEPDFSKLFFPRRLDEKGKVTLVERNKKGFLRILFNESEGNPAIALRMWTDSLSVNSDGNIVVRFVQAPDISVFEGVSITMLLVLRVILQCDYASEMDIMNSLRINRTRVSGILCFGIEQGWIENDDKYYRITWKWYRAITRILNRKNILKRIKYDISRK